MNEFDVTLCVSFHRKPAFDFPSETYADHVAFFLREGSFSYRLGDEEASHPLLPGQVVICPSGIAFHRRMSSPSTFCMIAFRTAGAYPFPREPLALRDISRFHDDLDRLRNCVVCRGMEEYPAYAHYARDLLYLACDSRNLAPSPLAKEYAYLGEHPEDACSMRALAASAGYSVAHFISLFRLSFGMSPKEYQLCRRIEKAQTFLRSTDLPVGEIARRVGYSDPLYFSRLFRRRTGLSPTEFRRMARV